MSAFTAIPEDILNLILDVLPIWDLLRLMAVNRLFRDVCLAHPCYWHTVDLDTATLSGTALESAIHLLSLRLERAGSRPVSIHLRGADLRPLLQRVLPHLPHIRVLSLIGLDMRYSQTVVNFLNKPAPILHTFEMRFVSTKPAPPCPVIGLRLFKSSAPCLRHVTLQNIALSYPAPSIFSNIPDLVYCITVDEVTFATEYFIRRRSLQVDRLVVRCPGAPPAGRFPWRAWRTIPSISAFGASLESCLAILDHLSGPLLLEAQISPCKTRAFFTFDSILEINGPATVTSQLSRLLGGNVPASREDPTIPRDSALYLAVCARADQITAVGLRLPHWDLIFAHVKRLPALTLLRVAVADGDVLADCSAPLEVPSLEQMVLFGHLKRRLARPLQRRELNAFICRCLRLRPRTSRCGYEPRHISIVPFPRGPIRASRRAGESHIAGRSEGLVAAAP